MPAAAPQPYLPLESPPVGTAVSAIGAPTGTMTGCGICWTTCTICGAPACCCCICIAGAAHWPLQPGAPQLAQNCPLASIAAVRERRRKHSSYIYRLIWVCSSPDFTGWYSLRLKV